MPGWQGCRWSHRKESVAGESLGKGEGRAVARPVIASIPTTEAAGRLARGEVGSGEGGVVKGLGEVVEDSRLVKLEGFRNE